MTAQDVQFPAMSSSNVADSEKPVTRKYCKEKDIEGADRESYQEPYRIARGKLTTRTMDSVCMLRSRTLRHERVHSCQRTSSTTLHAPEGRHAAQRIEQDEGN